MSERYDRFAKFAIEDVLPFIPEDRHTFSYLIGGEPVEKDVRMGGYRMSLWLRGTDCVCCGLKGTHIWLEQNTSGVRPAHFNLYGLDNDKNEVMLTTDHILAKSKGGKNDPDNLQLLCSRCNSCKRAENLTLEELRIKLTQPKPPKKVKPPKQKVFALSIFVSVRHSIKKRKSQVALPLPFSCTVITEDNGAQVSPLLVRADSSLHGVVQFCRGGELLDAGLLVDMSIDHLGIRFVPESVHSNGEL